MIWIGYKISREAEQKESSSLKLYAHLIHQHIDKKRM